MWGAHLTVEESQTDPRCVVAVCSYCNAGIHSAYGSYDGDGVFYKFDDGIICADCLEGYLKDYAARHERWTD